MNLHFPNFSFIFMIWNTGSNRSRRRNWGKLKFVID